MATLLEMMREEGNEVKTLLQGELTEATVHSVRKLIKRLRAQLRLLRPGLPEAKFDKLDRALGETGKSLGALREKAIARATFTLLLEEQGVSPSSPEIAPLLHQLETKEIAEDEVRARAQKHLEKSESALEKAVIRSKKSHLKLGYSSTYHKARQRLHLAKKQPGHPDRLHAFRKQVKHHLNQLRSLPESSRVESLEGSLDELGDLLGYHHDLADLERRLREVSEQTGLSIPEWLYAALEQKSADLAKKAESLGDALFAEPARRAAAASLSREDAYTLLGRAIVNPETPDQPTEPTEPVQGEVTPEPTTPENTAPDLAAAGLVSESPTEAPLG